MVPTQIYIEAFKRLVPFKVKYKSESLGQKIIAFLIQWYIPNYLSHYTTVMGGAIFFPDSHMLNRANARFTIAHEVVHLLDKKRLTPPIFYLLYLSPQIFTLGIFTFPWLGVSALWFLLFALPWPSPGRVYIEARAYGFEYMLYERCGYSISPSSFVDIFQSPAYYFMSWSKKFSAYWVKYFHEKSLEGTDPVFQKVLQVFESCRPDSIGQSAVN